MKVKPSVTLDAEVLNRIDGVLAEHETRSAFFEDAVIQLVEKREREKRDTRDLDILNARASGLNDEASENLSLVAEVFAEQGTAQP